MFFANHAFIAAVASGAIISGARRRGPGLLAMTTAALGELTRVSVRRLGLRAGTRIYWSLTSVPSGAARLDENNCSGAGMSRHSGYDVICHGRQNRALRDKENDAARESGLFVKGFLNDGRHLSRRGLGRRGH